METYKNLNKIFYKENPAVFQSIYEKRFNSESTVKLDFKIGEWPAFFVITEKILELVDLIRKTDKELARVVDELPSRAVDQYMISQLLDEVKLTNEIEGVHSTRREIRSALEEKKVSDRERRFSGMVKKYHMIAIEKRKIELDSCEDIRRLYDEIVLPEVIAVDETNAPDGEFFRKDISEVLSATQKIIHKGLYPESRIIEYVNKLLQILKGNKPNKLLNIAVPHYLFGYIHPFYDGNGRMARFISSYMLAQELQPLVAVSLSKTIKESANMYYGLFKAANDINSRGEVTAFTIGFLQIIAKTVLNVRVDIGEKYLKYLRYEIIIKESFSKNIEKFLETMLENTLFSDEGLTVSEIANEAKASSNTVRKFLASNTKIIDVDKSEKSFRYSLKLSELDELAKQLNIKFEL